MSRRDVRRLSPTRDGDRLALRYRPGRWRKMIVVSKKIIFYIAICLSGPSSNLDTRREAAKYLLAADMALSVISEEA